MPYEAVSFPIGGRNVYRGLIVLYSLIALYAALAVYFGAVTVGLAAGPLYAAIFPIALFICALAALWGVIRSRYTRQVWIEYAGTALLIAGLVSYSGSILYVAIDSGETFRIPGSVLPIIGSVFPSLRLLNILGVVKKRATAAAASRKLAEELASAATKGAPA